MRGKLGTVANEVTAEIAQDVCLKYIIFETWWSFHKGVPKSIKAYQLCKYNLLRVKYISSQKPENCDWQKSVSTASPLSNLQFMDLELLCLNMFVSARSSRTSREIIFCF